MWVHQNPHIFSSNFHAISFFKLTNRTKRLQTINGFSRSKFIKLVVTTAWCGRPLLLFSCLQCIHSKSLQTASGWGASKPKLPGAEETGWSWPILEGQQSDTLPKTNSSHLKIDPWKRRFLLETTIFRCYVSFQEGIYSDRFAQSPPGKRTSWTMLYQSYIVTSLHEPLVDEGLFYVNNFIPQISRHALTLQKKSIPFHTYQQKVLHNQQEPMMANQKSFYMTPTQTSYTVIIKWDHPPPPKKKMVL